MAGTVRLATAATAVAFESGGHGGFRHGIMKRMVSAAIDETLDEAQVTPEQRAQIHAARDRVFATVESQRTSRQAHPEDTLRLFEADRPDPATLETLHREAEAGPYVWLLHGGRTHMTTNARRETPKTAAVPEVANLGVVRPPLVYLTAILLGLGLHLARPVGLLARPAGTWLGAAAVLIALTLFVWAVRTFRAAGTPVPGHRPTTMIVRAGPYRFSRNPVYLAFSLFQLGLALWVDSLWLIVTLVPAVALMALVVVPREERYLAARFPAAYPSYRASVRRWL